MSLNKPREFWTIVGSLAGVASVVLGIITLNMAARDPVPTAVVPPEEGSKESPVVTSDPVIDERKVGKVAVSPARVAGCANEEELASSSADTIRAQIGDCWQPCDDVIVAVEEVFVDTDGRASDRVLIEWHGRQIKKRSYPVGAALQLTKDCQIRIDGTGDTRNSRYADLALSSVPDSIKLY